MNGFGFQQPVGDAVDRSITAQGHNNRPLFCSSLSGEVNLVARCFGDPEVDIEPRAPGGGDDTLFQPGRSPPPGGRIQDHDGITHCGFPVRERVGVEPTEAAEGAFQRF